jgi:hypothetical protein
MRLKEHKANNTTILLESDQTYYAASSVIVGEYPKFVEGKICKDKAEEDAHLASKKPKKAEKAEAK